MVVLVKCPNTLISIHLMTEQNARALRTWKRCDMINERKMRLHFLKIGRKMVFFSFQNGPTDIIFGSIQSPHFHHIFCYNKKNFFFLFEQLEYNDFSNLNPHALRFRSKYHFWIDETYSMRIVPDIIFAEVCVFLFGNILLRFLWPLESITIYVHFYGSCSFFSSPFYSPGVLFFLFFYRCWNDSKNCDLSLIAASASSNTYQI